MQIFWNDPLKYFIIHHTQSYVMEAEYITIKQKTLFSNIS